MAHREDQIDVAGTDGRRPWTAPAVRRMSAGSAEDGADDITDGGAFPS